MRSRVDHEEFRFRVTKMRLPRIKKVAQKRRRAYVDPAVNIRPFALEDTDSLFEAVLESYNELHPWMTWCHAGFARGDSREFIERQLLAFPAGDEYSFAITSQAGEILGVCGVNEVDRESRSANLGYWVRTSMMRKGIASAATLMLAKWVFENTNLIRLQIVASVKNLPSQRTAERAGAIKEGILRSGIMIHGAPHDAVVYSIIRADLK
jgi:ribosomal-protein-serine acetyltransferase